MFAFIFVIIGSHIANRLLEFPHSFQNPFLLFDSPFIIFLLGTLLLIVYLFNKNKEFFIFGLIFILNFLILFALNSIPISFWSYIFYLKPNLFGL